MQCDVFHLAPLLKLFGLGFLCIPEKARPSVLNSLVENQKATSYMLKAMNRLSVKGPQANVNNIKYIENINEYKYEQCGSNSQL